jgi:hypothetical protein
VKVVTQHVACGPNGEPMFYVDNVQEVPAMTVFVRRIKRKVGPWVPRVRLHFSFEWPRKGKL